MATSVVISDPTPSDTISASAESPLGLILIGTGPASALCHLGVVWRLADAGLLEQLLKEEHLIESTNDFTNGVLLPSCKELNFSTTGVGRDFSTEVARCLRRSLPWTPWSWKRFHGKPTATLRGKTVISIFDEDQKRQIVGQWDLEFASWPNFNRPHDLDKATSLNSKIEKLTNSRVLTELQRDYLVDWSYVLCDIALRGAEILASEKELSVSPNRLFYASLGCRDKVSGKALSSDGMKPAA